MQLMTQAEACAWMKVCRATLLKLREEKGLPYLRAGKRILYDQEKLAEWMELAAGVENKETTAPALEGGAKPEGENSNA